MKAPQKSSSFILPYLNVDYNTNISNGFKNTFLGDPEFTGTSEWGDYIFVEYDSSKLSASFTELLRSKGTYVDEYDPDKSTTIFVFDLSEIKDSVVKPFLEGKYSKISRKYVKKFFSPEQWSPSGWRKSNNWMILNKDPQLREYWEQTLDVVLPEDAEVWSRPEKEEEVKNYTHEVSE